ncbi:PepSY-like domain-containing protein [Oscillatoria sp. CS-180]|uniref:PepSY-like domain-containing protein n=1 Tax=Oscillatoria sp. CS-180 TaxID=3021720 RepID=UPI0023303EA9|nr:PepSY-like domain-containing protein [Oscillatoria sp. CS-180]MDB9524774.1 PepSY-like domain-containing protein [Oscillatoria sp. CS-180]
MQLPVNRVSLSVLMTTLCLGVAGCGGSGSQGSVPDVVVQAFNTTYPNISSQWEQMPYGYEAAFVQDGLEYEVEYSSDGEWLETEYEVQELQFPQAVLQAVRQQYPNYAITKYEIELTPTGTFYEVEVEGNGQEIELYFDEQGQPTANANEDA